MEIVTFAEIQKVKSSFEFKNSISSTQNCNEFRFFEPRFTSLTTDNDNDFDSTNTRINDSGKKSTDLIISVNDIYDKL